MPCYMITVTCQLLVFGLLSVCVLAGRGWHNWPVPWGVVWRGQSVCDCVRGVEMGDRRADVWVLFDGACSVRWCCLCVRAWYRCSFTNLIMASRTINNIVTDDHMQLDKVIDNYFNVDNSSDPNPLTSGKTNSLYHEIDTVGLQNLKDL